jgi:hypothetical protein
MDARVFKKIIKEAVKEAIQEEVKEILLEAIRTPKPVMHESQESSLVARAQATPSVSTRDKYREILGGMMDARNGVISMNTEHALGFGRQGGYTPPPTANTTAEGSALPAGEVNLNQIMGLINKK